MSVINLPQGGQTTRSKINPNKPVCRVCSTRLSVKNWHSYHRRKPTRTFICDKCYRDYQRGNSAHWRAANLDKVREQSRAYIERIRVDVMRHYSPEMKCQSPNCAVPDGMKDIRALSIDHVDGSGAKHRRTMKGSGWKLYEYLRLHSYPEGFQVLCMNCQFIKARVNGEFYRKKDTDDVGSKTKKSEGKEGDEDEESA